MAEQKVSLNLLGLPISLRFKRMKYARIRISKDCEISVSVPRSYTAAQAKDFILKHESWIRQTLERLRGKLLASDQVRILGKIYKLKFSREAELGTDCGASENLGDGGAQGCVNWANGDANSHAGSVNSAHLQSGAGISDGGDVSGSANNGAGGIGDDGADGGTGSEILKFHSGGCAPQSSNAGKFNSTSSGKNFKFNPVARDGILKFKPIAGEEILKFKPAENGEILKFRPAASGEISNFNSVASEEIPLMSEKISKSASENAPQNIAQSAQAAERDEPDFTIKNFIRSSKFKDKIFMSRDAIFCESEGEFAAFKKAFALELYLRYIEKFSPRIGRKIARVRVRKMQTRWGSCNHAKGYLNFSLSLIERDRRFVEYVVLHELAHLIHANHGADFYALIAQIMPDFRARIKLGKG